ncbi:Lrp/AsnC family transcriptional regulator [Phytoactinopolyspora limicola]|uniref:Lrp/AsnC family transcriptional regulator n=1 Tax=Phytoactinopolyspora limicola TaxID=2715536 RepID=UPI00140D62E7|nr:Lrp/AsnC family transcriptional regulator [Phytoactinopolyspora limicola]
MSGSSQYKDRLIILELLRDARQSNVALAKKVGLSEGAVRRRIEKLVESGRLIFTVVPDAAYMGRNVHAMIRIQSAPGATERLVDELVSMHELSYVYHCTGQFDITVVGFFKSNDELREFTTGKLGKTDGIVEIRTVITLRVAKRFHEWSLDNIMDDLDSDDE